jgi:anti-sigma factor RsiW
MDCSSVRERLWSLVRGRAEAEDELELRRHLTTCEACRHEERAERLLDEALGDRLPRPAAPAALRRRVAELAGAAARPAPQDRLPVRLRAPAARAAMAAAAALLLAALGFAAGRAAQLRAAGSAALSDELVTDHLRALASAHPHDVESSDSHQVKPWFLGRLDFAPVVPGDRGELRLLGGALGYVHDRKAAVVSYGLRRHRVTLLAVPRAGLTVLDRADPAGRPVRVERRGFTVALWAAGDLGYALVSDVDPEELGHLADELAKETRKAPSPG